MVLAGLEAAEFNWPAKSHGCGFIGTVVDSGNIGRTVPGVEMIHFRPFVLIALVIRGGECGR
jgi:hypothetical protein